MTNDLSIPIYYIYAEQHSYKELPIRYAETLLYLEMKLWEMQGLIRVRQFTLADGHLIVTPEQLEDEFRGVVDLIKYVMKPWIQDDITYRFSSDPNNKKNILMNQKLGKILKILWETS